MNIHFVLGAVLIIALELAGCAKRPTPEPQTATIIVTFDLGGGGSGKSATIYVQEVNSGKSYSQPYSSSGHVGVVLPTSAPLVFTVEAPGTYIAYANLVNSPEDYHFGATSCEPAPDCTTTVLMQSTSPLEALTSFTLAIVPASAMHLSQLPTSW